MGREGPGYRPDMAEQPKDLVDEAQRGRSERTPVIAVSGVALGVTAVVAVILLAALLVYYLVK